MLALETLKRIYINNPDTRFQRNNIDINFTIHDFFNVNEAIKELEALENRSCDNCKNASFEIKFGELEFNACFLVSNGNVCKWESK